MIPTSARSLQIGSCHSTSPSHRDTIGEKAHRVQRTQHALGLLAVGPLASRSWRDRRGTGSRPTYRPFTHVDRSGRSPVPCSLPERARNGGGKWWWQQDAAGEFARLGPVGAADARAVQQVEGKEVALPIGGMSRLVYRRR